MNIRLYKDPELRASALSGNALIYVLIAIALFGALSFTLSRQTANNQEAVTMAAEEVELSAVRVLTYSAQVENVINQMLFIGSQYDDLDFVRPGEASFDTQPLSDKVFHPSGGGLTGKALESKVVAQIDNNPPAGWYLGRFNNVEWSDTSEEDVILVAHQIRQDICSYINGTLTGMGRFRLYQVRILRMC